MTEIAQQTEEPTWLKLRKRIRMLALALLGLCTLCLMSGIGLLTLGAKLPGIILLVLFIVLLLVGIYLNAASRLIRYSDGSSEWEWEKKERLKK
jgi:heme A synthase